MLLYKTSSRAVKMFLLCSLQAPVKIAVIFKQLRVLIESVLKKKLENPKMSLEGNFIAALLM